MQTNILGPKDARYVITLTDLGELTKKETAILLACVQDYYEETIHRLNLALIEPHGEDELAFLACVLTQFYHKVEIDLPGVLLKIANMEIEIEDETTNLIRLFLLQIHKGFKGFTVKEISEDIIKKVEERKTVLAKGTKSLSSNDLEYVKLAFLADELCNITHYSLALKLYEKASQIITKLEFVDRIKWRNAMIFDEAYRVGVEISNVNINLPETERELLNQLHQVRPLYVH